MKEETIGVTNILFDPNNLRFHDTVGFQQREESRFAEESVQEHAYQRLRRDESLGALKNSIQTNGYIPVEKVVVRPHAASGKYVVVEGNRRLAAIKWILEDHEAGVPVDASVLQSIKDLPCIVVEDEVPDEAFRASLMGIRHVSGIKQWGGYQRAKLVAMMHDDLDMDLSSDIADRLGMSSHEVIRRYRAFKALEQMQNDEEFGDFASAELYPIFHEAVAIPIVREWLGWQETAFEFDDPREFYELIVPIEVDEETVAPKITSHRDVRQLREILGNLESKEVLSDPHRDFLDALTIARQEEASKVWRSDVARTISALEKMNVSDLKAFDDNDKELLEKLKRVAEERLDDHESLTNK